MIRQQECLPDFPNPVREVELHTFLHYFRQSDCCFVPILSLADQLHLFQMFLFLNLINIVIMYLYKLIDVARGNSIHKF